MRRHLMPVLVLAISCQGPVFLPKADQAGYCAQETADPAYCPEDVEDVIDADGDGVPAGDQPEDDCNDNDPGVHPWVEEVCDDDIDNDCDGDIDEVDENIQGRIEWTLDADGDGQGLINGQVSYTCPGDLSLEEEGYSLYPFDCDDDDPDVNTYADEICGDGIDNDCNGTIDDVDCFGGDDTGDPYQSSSSDTG